MPWRRDASAAVCAGRRQSRSRRSRCRRSSVRSKNSPASTAISRPSAMKRVVVAPTNLLYSVLPDDLRALAGAARSMACAQPSVGGRLRRCALPACPWQAAGALCSGQWLGRPGRVVRPPRTYGRRRGAADGESSTGMAHCPQSNCRLGSGIALADRLAALGGRVSLGVDGAASSEACDMIGEMHCAWQVHRAAKGPAAVTRRSGGALGDGRRRRRAGPRRGGNHCAGHAGGYRIV